MDLADWRRHIAHVPQRPHLFDGDVVENVAMGRFPGGGDVEAAVVRALAAARADAVVARLPGGLRTRIGENGFGLSGGEAQRLALARAIFAPAPLVLFDEPTAHLDPATESDLAQAMDALAAGRTTITIAHRLATVRHADRILVLDRGRIVESGRHEDLKALSGTYARLIASAGIEPLVNEEVGQ
jgi:ATP-binding cassette subfamily C protein CydD